MTSNHGNNWHSGLLDCFDDGKLCLCGWLCTPYVFGQNANKVLGKNSVLMACTYCILGHCYLCWIPHFVERQALREKYNLQEDLSYDDCLTTLCCSPCGVCQEAREIKYQEAIRDIEQGKNITPITTPPKATLSMEKKI